MESGKGKILITLGVLALLAGTALGTTLFLSEKQKTLASSTEKQQATTLLKASMTQGQTNDKSLLHIDTSQVQNCNASIALDEKALLSLPQQRFKTRHTWSDTAQEFSGPLLSDVLNLACHNVTRLMLKAINDYSIEMDFNEMRNYQPIVAITVDGKRLSVRHKGPLWVMMPLDRFDELPPRSMDDMLIWQLSDISIIAANEST